MKEIPLLYKPDMAQAAHDGTKTNTRRIKNNVPEKASFAIMAADKSADVKLFSSHMDGSVGISLTGWIKSKYGKPGDLIYIKEEHYIYGKWVIDGLTKKTRKPKFNFVDLEIMPVKFPKNKPTIIETDRSEMGYFKRNSLFMPKKYCRTWLKIKYIRVERLQDITTRDILAEGIRREPGEHDIPDIGPTVKKKFKSLWDSINGKPRNDGKDISWAANPWVWVIEFERIER